MAYRPRFRLQPPTEWPDFETLCWSLWKAIWRDDNTQKHGRKGQPQNGVDIYGQPDKGPALAGVQCKGKDNYAKRKLTRKEVLDEVAKAKSFDPKLSKFIIATTASRDREIQKLARKITTSHKAKGLFSVTVCSWEDIEDLLLEYKPEIGRQWYSAELGCEATDRVEGLFLQIMDRLPTPSSPASISSAPPSHVVEDVRGPTQIANTATPSSRARINMPDGASEGVEKPAAAEDMKRVGIILSSLGQAILQQSREDSPASSDTTLDSAIGRILRSTRAVESDLPFKDDRRGIGQGIGVMASIEKQELGSPAGPATRRSADARAEDEGPLVPTGINVKSVVVSEGFDCVSIMSQIQQELAAWNYDNAMELATKVESAFKSGRAIDKLILPGILILLARVYINRVETKRRDSAPHVKRAKALLKQAEEMLGADDSDRFAEIWALKASLESLENGPDAALTLLEGRVDPYAVRSRVALLLNQTKTIEALQVIQELEPHERWCDVAVTAYSLNDRFDKARAIVTWAASLPNRSRFPQCAVCMANALMARSLVEHGASKNIHPQDISERERKGLEEVLDVLHPVLGVIKVAERPTSELDMRALGIAWQANHLLQRREEVVVLMGLMASWTPVPVEVGRGVASGYIKAPIDLPDRLRHDHPDDLGAGILAAVVQSSRLGHHREAFAKAKDLLVLAVDNEKKEDLFRLFQQLGQNLDIPEASECEHIASTLVGHNPQLRTIYGADILLRKGDADGALIALEAVKAEDDIYWLQLRANALLFKRQTGEAVESLLVVAKKTFDPDLLRKTGDVAYTAKKTDVAIWCYERLAEIDPRNMIVRGNLAHIYAFVWHDLEKAAVQFRALHSIEPDNPAHAFNLAVCLAQLYQPEDSLALYDQLCGQDKPPLQAVLGRAHLHYSLGHPEDALTSLNPFRDLYWTDPAYLLAYMNTAYAAGDESGAYDALNALNALGQSGKIKSEVFRAINKDEALEMFKQSSKQTQDRTEHLHAEMQKGRMPWVWAEQMSNNAIYWGWGMRTQEVAWIGDDPANRARFCIYSTNGFHARKSDHGGLELLPLVCPPAGTRVVVDISALITLHRLGLLDKAADYFGEILVPTGYLSTVLEDSRQMVLHQRSRRTSAEQITKKVNAARISILSEAAKAQISAVDEYGEYSDHRYRLVDLLGPVRQAGCLSDAEFNVVSKAFFKPSAVDELHPVLEHLQAIVIGLSTLETLANFGLLDAITGFYRVHIFIEAEREILRRQEAMAYQDEVREWHIDLWNHVCRNPRFRFVPHKVPEQMSEAEPDLKDDLPFLGSFIALETKTPLLADDRVCHALILNEMSDTPNAVFGTDVLLAALSNAGRIDMGRFAAAIKQLMQWRYRFIMPPPEVMKIYADKYRTNPPGQSLRDVAEYVHDCMRDAGLFGGREKTERGESMAMRLYMAWVSTIAEFLILVWKDESFPEGAAACLTEWSVRELLPSSPRVLHGSMRLELSSLTPRLFLSHALINASMYPGNPRLANAMKALKDGLRLDDDRYCRIVTGILNDTAKSEPRI